MKKTLIIGASANPERYSYKAAERLLHHGHEIELLGAKSEEIFGRKISVEKNAFSGVHTVTLYVGPQRQSEFFDYVLLLAPKRVIFNPGTENEEFESLLKQNGIEVEESCTLVLLATNQY